jgi:hypothetical protein
MTIAQGAASLVGQQYMRASREKAPIQEYHEHNVDRYRTVYMPGYIRRLASNMLPAYQVDWFAWIKVTGSATSDDYHHNLYLDTMPIRYDVEDWDGTVDDRSANMVPGTRNSGVTLGYTETLTGPTTGTIGWGNGTDTEGYSPPVHSGARAYVPGNQRLPKQLEDQYGASGSYLERNGFIRFVVRMVHEGVTEPTAYEQNLAAIHLEEDSEGDDTFSPLLGEAKLGNGVDTVYHDSMPVNAYILRYADAMLTRYLKEARYNQTVVMGELTDSRTNYTTPAVGKV